MVESLPPGEPIRVVCWLWKPERQYRSQFRGTHVNIFARMVSRHLSIPHEIVCVTDIPEGIDESLVRIIPLWPAPDIGRHNPHLPNCYRRLRAYSPEMREIIGPRFISMDLDCLIMRDITPILSRPEDFVIWGATAKNTLYNGSMWMMTAGARAHVWEKFEPRKSPEITRGLRMVGSDQAWVSHILGPGEAMFTQDDGVYSFRNHIRPANGKVPKDARIVFFHGGGGDPWDGGMQRRFPWIAEHYR